MRANRDVWVLAPLDVNEQGTQAAACSEDAARQVTEAFAKMARGDPKGVDDIAHLLGASKESVRNATVQAIAGIASQGNLFAMEIVGKGLQCDLEAMSVVARGLEDADESGRLATIKALAGLAAYGDEKSIQTVAQQLQHGQVHAQSMQRSGSDSSTCTIAPCDVLADEHPGPEKILGSCDPANGLESMEDIVRLLEGADEPARAVGIDAIAKVAAQGDYDAMKIIAQSLQCDLQAMHVIAHHLQDTPESFGQTSVIITIAKLAAQGEMKAIETIAHRLVEADAYSASLAAGGETVHFGDLEERKSIASRLSDADVSVQAAAMNSISMVAAQGDLDAMEVVARGLQGNSKAVKIISHLLQDADESIQKAAVMTLSKLAAQGDDNANEMLLRHLDHVHAKLWDKAKHASSHDPTPVIADHDDAIAAGAVDGKLSDPETELDFITKASQVDVPAQDSYLCQAEDTDELVASSVEMASLQNSLQFLDIMTCSLEEPDEYLKVIAIIARRFEHSDPSVRKSAVEAIARIAPRGDSQAIEMIARCLEDGDESVRSIAVETLGLLAWQGDSKAIEGIANCLQDEFVSVRHSAVWAMGELAFYDDLKSLEVLTHCLEDADANVRAAAMDAMALVAPQGNVAAIGMIAEQLEDADASVRSAAVRTLGELACEGDSKVVAFIVQRFRDTHECVRSSAVRAIGELSRPGDLHAIEIISRHLGDVHESVRRAAVDAIARVAVCRNWEAICEIILRVLADRQLCFREFAVEALLLVVPRGDLKAIQMIARCLEDEDASVRSCAVMALGELTHRGDMESVKIIARSLEHPNVNVREAAREAMSKLDE